MSWLPLSECTSRRVTGVCHRAAFPDATASARPALGGRRSMCRKIATFSRCRHGCLGPGRAAQQSRTIRQTGRDGTADGSAGPGIGPGVGVSMHLPPHIRCEVRAVFVYLIGPLAASLTPRVAPRVAPRSERRGAGRGGAGSLGAAARAASGSPHRRYFSVARRLASVPLSL